MPQILLPAITHNAETGDIMWVVYQSVRMQHAIRKHVEGTGLGTDDKETLSVQPGDVDYGGRDQARRETLQRICEDDEIGCVDAHSWNRSTKYMATVIVGTMSSLVAFATAVSASLVKPMAAEFGVTQVVDNSVTAMFLFGFGIGSLVTGPFSETCGRWLVFVATMALMMACLAISGSAHHLAQQLVFRFCAGFLGSSPLVCAGGIISDLWEPFERVSIFPLFAIIAFIGSTMAPIVGGAITKAGVDWRWGDWITIAVLGVGLAMVVVFLPETLRPLLLKLKVQTLSKRTRSLDVHELMPEDAAQPSLLNEIIQGLYLPFVLSIQEPTVQLFTFYISLIYIILLTSLNGYTFIFSNTYGFDNLQTGLAFLPMLVGNFLVALLVPYANRQYQKNIAKSKQKARDANDKKPEGHHTRISVDDITPPPECHLRYAMFGSPCIPIALFWMAFTARPDISPWSPLAGSTFFGFGFTSVFIACYQYLASCYGIYTASALSAVNCLRAFLSGGMMMASMPMYQTLGVQYSLLLLAIVSTAMVPVPFAFAKYGRSIRKRSSHAGTVYGEELSYVSVIGLAKETA